MAEGVSKEESQKKKKKDSKDLDWMPYIRRDGGADDYKPEVRERIKQTEIEKDNGKFFLLKIFFKIF